MIKLTDAAAKEVKSIISKQLEGEDSGEFYLRVGVKGGGCSGFNYSMDLVDTKTEDDETFEHHGVTVIVDPKSNLYLAGTEIDFRDELMGRGFVFNNPNATSRCGCGSSFSV